MIDKRTGDTLQDLEKRLHRRDVRGSRTAVDELLANGFTEIGRSGRLYDKAQLLAALASETGMLAVETADFAFREIAKDIVLLTYRAHDRRRGHTLRATQFALEKERRPLADGVSPGNADRRPLDLNHSVIHVAPQALVGEVEQHRERQ